LVLFYSSHYIVKIGNFAINYAQAPCGRLVVFSRNSTNKTDCHDIAEILLKVALNTLIPAQPPSRM
jgi:hypothetical protein